MGSANTIFRKKEIAAKHAKPYKEIPFPNPSHIQRRIVPQEELEAFQTEEAEIVANMHKLMQQHYKIQENKNASQEKVDVVNGAKLTSIFNQQLHLASPSQVADEETIKKLASHNKISEEKMRSLLKYYDVPAWHYNKQIVDMKIGYDRLGPLPGTE